MALAVEKDETLDPVDIRLFGADAVMPGTQVDAHALQQLGRAGRFGAAWGWLQDALWGKVHPENFRFD